MRAVAAARFVLKGAVMHGDLLAGLLHPADVFNEGVRMGRGSFRFPLAHAAFHRLFSLMDGSETKVGAMAASFSISFSKIFKSLAMSYLDPTPAAVVSHCVHHLMSDEGHRQSSPFYLVHDAQDVGGLLDAKCRNRFVKEQHAGTKVNCAGDGRRLPLSPDKPPTKRSPSSILVIPKLRTASTANSFAPFRSLTLKDPQPFVGSTPMKKLCPTDIIGKVPPK
jgi:hypothetical protein